MKRDGVAFILRKVPRKKTVALNLAAGALFICIMDGFFWLVRVADKIAVALR